MFGAIVLDVCFLLEPLAATLSGHSWTNIHLKVRASLFSCGVAIGGIAFSTASLMHEALPRSRITGSQIILPLC